MCIVEEWNPSKYTVTRMYLYAGLALINANIHTYILYVYTAYIHRFAYCTYTTLTTPC